MEKRNKLKTKTILISIVVCFQIAACASPRPVLYPNTYLNKVGQNQANQDITECQRIAESYVSSSNMGKNIAKNTAAGAGVGAASGAVGGAIRGSAGSGAAVGAAAGATAGLLHGLFRNDQSNPAYKNFVGRCLRDRGYELTGWN